MLRLIAVITASAATLAGGTLPASAAADGIHAFRIPAVSGVRAWGRTVMPEPRSGLRSASRMPCAEYMAPQRWVWRSLLASSATLT